MKKGIVARGRGFPWTLVGRRYVRSVETPGGRPREGVGYVTITLYCDGKRRIVADIIQVAPGNVGLKILELPEGLPDGISRRVWNPPGLERKGREFKTEAEAEAYTRQWWEENKVRLLA